MFSPYSIISNLTDESFENISANLLSSFEKIIDGKIRSNVHVIRKSFDQKENIISHFLKEINGNIKCCYINFDIFNKSQQLEEDSEILTISLKMSGESTKTQNVIEFSFDVQNNYYLVCDMHIIYLFERVFHQIMKDYNPELFFLYIPLSFQNFSNNDGKTILTGDCKNIKKFNNNQVWGISLKLFKNRFHLN